MALHLHEHITATLGTQERYTLALAGGSTPETLYRILSGTAGDADARDADGPDAGTHTDIPTDIPWERVHLFWGDERYVPHDHPKSNVRLARETLLRNAAVPEANVHPMPTNRPADEAAAAYTDTLQRFFATPSGAPRTTFDAVLLGLGSDGHTASLFPENAPASYDAAWVRVVEAPPRHDVATRLTCTLPVLNGATRAFFLVAGARKHDALTGVLDRRDPALPATHVQARSATHWFTDRAARFGNADST